jgi:uncharacterized membrane protein
MGATSRAFMFRVASSAALVGCGAFLYTGITKFTGLQAVSGAVAKHGVVPISMARSAAIGVGVVEVGCGVVGLALLAMNLHRHLSKVLMLAAGLLAVFALYATWLTIEPPVMKAPCGCGDSTRIIEDWTPLAIRNWALAGVCACMGLWARRVRNAREGIEDDAPAQVAL